MARYLIPSDTTIKAVRSGDPRKRLTDGDGLYLLLFVKGGAHGWRFDYTFQGLRKTLSLGTYPSTTLAIARRKADTAREQVADGQDPSQARKVQRAGFTKAIEAKKRLQLGLPALDSFEDVAREWFEVRRGWRVVAGCRAIRTRSSPGWRTTYFPISAGRRWRTSCPPSCWRCCGASRRVA